MLDSEKITYRDLKRKLAREIISIYYDTSVASQAEQHFIDVFVKKVAPDDVKTVKVSSTIKIVDFLYSEGLVQSKGECKRLIKQSAVKLNDVSILDVNYEIQPSMDATIKVGKRKFIEIV